VSSQVGDRDLEGSVKLCNRNREFSKRDFPIMTRVWATGDSAENRWHRRLGIGEP
jgi:hypothetical protein